MKSFIIFVLGVLQMSRLFNNEFSEKVSQFTVIDCRYPYEYNGGHIKVHIILCNLINVQSLGNLEFLSGLHLTL